MLRFKPLCLAMLGTAVLCGCTVSPQPLQPKDVLETALAEKGLIFASQEPIDETLTMSEAMARAVKYNLENRMQLMLEALSDSSFSLAKLDMLPILTLTGSYYNRNNVDASRSYNIITKQDNFSYSTSQDQEYQNVDVSFSWNVLDFGVSYIQAKQEADRYLISQLGRKRVVMRLMEQARGAYWRAVAMQSVSNELNGLLQRARTILFQLEEVRASQLATPMLTLQDMRALIEIIQQLEEMQQTVNLSIIELSTLINEKPGSDIIVDVPTELPAIPVLPANLERLELTALANSADYQSEIYNSRVDQLESRKAMMRLYPGLEFSYGENYATNSYLYHDSWGIAGVRLTSNLMRLVSRDEVKEQNEARNNLAAARRMVMNMAVLTQVHLSWQQYANTAQRLLRAEQLDMLDQELANLSQQSRALSASSGVSEIQTRARSLRSRMSRLMAYADAQISFGTFLTSLGLDPVPPNYQAMSVDELSEHIDGEYRRWEDGRIPTYDPETLEQTSMTGGASAIVVSDPLQFGTGANAGSEAALATEGDDGADEAGPVISITGSRVDLPDAAVQAGNSAPLPVPGNDVPAGAGPSAPDVEAPEAASEQAPQADTQDEEEAAATGPGELPANEPETASGVANTNTNARIDVDNPAVVAAVNATVDGWLTAWSNGNVERYLAAYHDSFTPSDDSSAAAWREERRARLNKLDAVSVTRSEIERRAISDRELLLRFTQHYRSPDYSDDTRKELVLLWEGGRFFITFEKSLEVKVRND